MGYNLQRSDPANPIVSVTDETIGSLPPLSIPLVGRNYINYGEVVDQSLLHLLENFRSASEPMNPIPGQIWYDDITKSIKVNVGDDDGPANAAWDEVVTLDKTTPLIFDPGDITDPNIINAIGIIQSIDTVEASVDGKFIYGVTEVSVPPELTIKRDGSPYTIDAIQMISILMQAIKDLQAQIDTYHP